ncbi:hypothetical protein J6590_026465 [Homalodisca vitripennis]|nr:hypothetical protein J6590_026462 [Homalodisca vitripennis]KAG8327126.1 hypothetical protein J6590_026465 [Homalodisca vitripennis]
MKRGCHPLNSPPTTFSEQVPCVLISDKKYVGGLKIYNHHELVPTFRARLCVRNEIFHVKLHAFVSQPDPALTKKSEYNTPVPPESRATPLQSGYIDYICVVSFMQKQNEPNLGD